MKITKKHIVTLFNVLHETNNLNLADARIRDRILPQIKEEFQNLANEETKIFEKFAEKDSEDNFIKENNQYTFKKEALEEVKKEQEILYSEEVEFSTDETKIKSIIENTDYKPKSGETVVIDEILAKL